MIEDLGMEEFSQGEYAQQETRRLQMELWGMLTGWQKRK
jgi:hypothetical protein